MTKHAATHVCSGCAKTGYRIRLPDRECHTRVPLEKRLFSWKDRTNEKRRTPRQTPAELLKRAEADRLVSVTPSCTAKRCLLPDRLQTGSGLENL